MRDLPGFMETRQMLLKIKPGNRTNWISFAIAHHLNGSHDLAVQMLDTFETNIMGVRVFAILHVLKRCPHLAIQIEAALLEVIARGWNQQSLCNKAVRDQR